VVLIGAGPGDAELITLKGARRLERADVVVYDNLVGRDVLELARPEAKRIFVGKMAGHHSLPQEDICRLLIDEARAGNFVARLKGGDPFVFGRGGEELEALQAAGIPVEVVPGITAALGAAASFGFPLTHRDHAQSCVFATGRLGSQHLDLDWPALARPGQTVVIYMGVARLGVISERLQAAGMPGNTPAALIHRATFPDQRAYRGTLSTLPEIAQKNGIEPPTLVVIGHVVRCQESEERL
jgi:uroporphyrin-III C-methyltransferase